MQYLSIYSKLYINDTNEYRQDREIIDQDDDDYDDYDDYSRIELAPALHTPGFGSFNISSRPVKQQQQQYRVSLCGNEYATWRPDGAEE